MDILVRLRRVWRSLTAPPPPVFRIERHADHWRLIEERELHGATGGATLDVEVFRSTSLDVVREHCLQLESASR